MGYSTIDIEKGLGISRERLREWTAKEFVSPSIPSPGQGKRAEFSRRDIMNICLFDELLRIGFKRKTAGDCVKSASPYLWGVSPKSPTEPDYLLIRFDGDSVHANPIWGETGVVIDFMDGGKRKRIDPFSGTLMSLLESRGITKELEGAFDHLHVVNLKEIHNRVNRAFPG